MKRCPECRRDYFDDSLLYCLDDGSALLEGPASIDEPLTAIWNDAAGPSEAGTQAQIHTSQKTAILANVHPHTASRKNTFIAGAIGIIVITALGVGSYSTTAAKARPRSDRSRFFLSRIAVRTPTQIISPTACPSR